jgi:uncharacterized protein YidB (DUF937 family)
MGLLDSVLGQVLGGGALQQQRQGEQMGGVDLGSLAGALGGLLANNGSQGGLGGLIDKFGQAGMGDTIGSWIGSGQNEPISGEQVQDALGRDTISDLASRLGVNASMLLPLLATLLPMLIDRLTPQGQAPAGGLGNQDDLTASLSNLLQKG